MNNVKIAMIAVCPFTDGGGTNKRVHRLADLLVSTCSGNKINHSVTKKTVLCFGLSGGCRVSSEDSLS